MTAVLIFLFLCGITVGIWGLVDELAEQGAES